MNILLTGGSGFLGRALTGRLLDAGHRVYSLSRHPPEPRGGLVPLTGDILSPNLGVKEFPKVDCVFHLAAKHNLGKDKGGSIWVTNVVGTQNVFECCVENKIHRVFFCSTAYTVGRNTYEKSKIQAEIIALKYRPKMDITVLKPSIIMGAPDQHFGLFVSLIIRLHQRAEIVRRAIEGTLRLPVIEPVFRLPGNPDGHLNLIKVDTVADEMAKMPDWSYFNITNPFPPTLRELTEWTGKYLLMRIELKNDFKETPIELMFQKLGAPFLPYLNGDNMVSDLHEGGTVNEQDIKTAIMQALR